MSTGPDSALLSPAPSVASAYESFAPPLDLSRCVERIHLGYEIRPADAPIDERVLPDGAVHLLFNLGEAPAIVGAPPQPGRAAEALGASTAAVVIRMAGHVEHVGVRLRAGGAAALLGVPAGELTDASAPLDALWGPAAREAHERLAEAPRGEARVAVLEDILRERLRGARIQPHPAAAHAERRIRRARGRIMVRELAATLGLGERRLEQVFRAHVGLSPKAACRLARFHATLCLARDEPARRWSEIAHRVGFADQAHLTRELRAFSGLTPRELRARFGFVQDDAPPRA